MSIILEIEKHFEAQGSTLYQPLCRMAEISISPSGTWFFVKDAILASLITLQLMYSVGFVEIMLFQDPVICCSLFV